MTTTRNRTGGRHPYPPLEATIGDVIRITQQVMDPWKMTMMESPNVDAIHAAVTEGSAPRDWLDDQVETELEAAIIGCLLSGDSRFWIPVPTHECHACGAPTDCSGTSLAPFSCTACAPVAVAR